MPYSPMLPSYAKKYMKKMFLPFFLKTIQHSIF